MMCKNSIVVRAGWLGKPMNTPVVSPNVWIPESLILAMSVPVIPISVVGTSDKVAIATPKPN